MTLSPVVSRVEPRRPTGRSRRRRVLVALLVVLVAGAGWWWSHPTLFPEPGDEVMMTAEPGQLIYLGMARVPDGESVHLVDVSPRVMHAFGAAEVVGVTVCRLVDPRSGIGVVDANGISELCRSVGAPSGPMQADDQLLVEVVADEAAVVVVQGVDVTYTTRYQRGTQTTGPTATVVVRSP